MENIDGMQNKLENVVNIEFTEHAELTLKTRKIDKNYVLKCLKVPKNLIDVEQQQDIYLGEKYKLTFIKSKKYTIVIVVNFLRANGSEKAIIVTLYKKSAKRSKKVLKWLEKKRK